MGEGVLFSRTSSSTNILIRQETTQTLSSTQQQVDEGVIQFVDQATEWRSLASMMVGGLAYRLEKLRSWVRARACLPMSRAIG